MSVLWGWRIIRHNPSAPSLAIHCHLAGVHCRYNCSKMTEFSFRWWMLSELTCSRAQCATKFDALSRRSHFWKPHGSFGRQADQQYVRQVNYHSLASDGNHNVVRNGFTVLSTTRTKCVLNNDTYYHPRSAAYKWTIETIRLTGTQVTHILSWVLVITRLRNKLSTMYVNI